MLLDKVRIGTPCSAGWEAMAGDDRVRFCGGCKKNVYNLSAMTRAEAERLIVEREGPMCVRLYRREDGTVMTSDCPVGLRRLRIRRAVATVVGAGAMALAATAMAWRRGSPAAPPPPAQQITAAPEIAAPVLAEPVPPAMEQPDYETRPPPPPPPPRRAPAAPRKPEAKRMIMGDLAL
jgi:hypothetical protein